MFLSQMTHIWIIDHDLEDNLCVMFLLFTKHSLVIFIRVEISEMKNIKKQTTCYVRRWMFVVNDNHRFFL